MTFLFLRSNCETSVYCYIAVTCYGVNDSCGTGLFKLKAHINPTQVTTFNSLLGDPLKSALISHA